MAFPLLKLPNELIGRIAAELVPCKTLLSLRAVCRHLYLQTFHEFGRGFFDKRSTDLSPKSIQRLHEVAAVEALRPYIQTLRLFRQAQYKVENPKTWRWPEGRIKDPAAFPGVSDLWDLLVHKWTNCRSYIAYAERCVPLEDDTYGTIYPSDMIEILLTTILVNKLPVKSLTFDFHNIALSNSWGPDSVDFTKYQPPALQVPFAHLEALRLRIRSDRKTEAKWLLVLLQQAPALKIFYMSLGYLYGAYFCFDLVAAERLPPLRQISLNILQIHSNLLLKLLSRFSDTLQSLSLTLIILTGHGTWREFFRILDKVLPYLVDIRVDRLSEDMGDLEFSNLFPDGAHYYDGFEVFNETPSGPIKVKTYWTGEEVAEPTSGPREVQGARFQGPSSKMGWALEELARTGKPKSLDLEEPFWHFRPETAEYP